MCCQLHYRGMEEGRGVEPLRTFAPTGFKPVTIASYWLALPWSGTGGSNPAALVSKTSEVPNASRTWRLQTSHYNTPSSSVLGQRFQGPPRLPVSPLPHIRMVGEGGFEPPGYPLTDRWVVCDVKISAAYLFQEPFSIRTRIACLKGRCVPITLGLRKPPVDSRIEVVAVVEPVGFEPTCSEQFNFVIQPFPYK